MAQTYSDDSTAAHQRDSSLLNDTSLKWGGATIAGAFALTVAYLLFEILQSFVDWELLQDILPNFGRAFLLVLAIVVISSILSILLGIFIGLGRVSNTFVTHKVSSVYVEFFRGTPLLFQLLVIYSGAPAFGVGQFPEWKYFAAVIGLSLNHAAYVGEAIKGGINTVPAGQMEAARSLGLSYTDAMVEIILPQAWRNALAALGNDQVILVKDTSLLTFIAVPELIRQFQNVNSTYLDAWTPILLVCVFYLAITLPLGWIVRTMETRSAWGETDE